MMQLLLFKYQEDKDHLREVRTVEIDGEIWFVASDVCRLLGYKNVSDAIARHCKPKGIVKRDIPSTSGTQQMTLINEGNLYRLIVKSQLPSAEKFEAWVFEEVIPSIRKTGSYTTVKLLPTYQTRILSEPTKSVPNGHWSIFDESHSIMLWVEANVGSVNQFDLVDGSIGSRWARYREDKEWAVDHRYYDHQYSDVRGARSCKCYHDSELPHFRAWLKTVYKPQHLPKYLQDKYTKEQNPAMLNRVNAAVPKLLTKGTAA